MSYDEDLANRIREVLSGEHLEEKRMFGGLAFLVGGHMAVCISGQGGLMVRVPPEETGAARPDRGESDDHGGPACPGLAAGV